MIVQMYASDDIESPDEPEELNTGGTTAPSALHPVEDIDAIMN